MQKQKRLVRFRTDSAHVAKWVRAAKSRQQDLSSFARDALDAAAIGLVTGVDLDRQLLILRSTVHAALSVRTDDQRRERIERVLAAIQSMLAREEISPDA
jgi:hypothetical protein